MTTEALATQTGTYTLDPAHSRLGFVARHAMVTKVRGQFNDFEGSAHLDFENPVNSTAEVSIDVASVDTRSAQRDGHLRTNDFFDAENHPKITFRSTAARVIDNEHYEVTGDLTIKGISKPVSIVFEYAGTADDPFGNTRVGFEGSVQVNRSDWGVTFNAPLAAGGVLVSEKVTLEFELSAIKAQPAA
jgi:polyisoprenoid-binding protein YceI